MSDQFSAQGTAQFKAGAFLKAAALYTKALNALPADASERRAVLLSNRCACLLKLHKLDKALADAQQCVSLRGDWDKAHYRVGSALEALGRHAEARAAFGKARECNPGSAEVAAKLHAAAGTTNRKASAPAGAGPATNGSGRDAGGGTAEGARLRDAQVTHKVTTAEEYVEANDAMVAGAEVGYSEERVLRFAAEVRAAAAEQLAGGAGGGAAAGAAPAGRPAGGATAAPPPGEEAPPCVYFLPGRRASEDAVEQWGQVRVAAAFESPDTLQSALAFLREYAADTGAHAACAVVRRRDIAFPQVWRRRGWPLGDEDGCFVQLEARGLRRVWFVRPGAEAAELAEDFKLIEALFR